MAYDQELENFKTQINLSYYAAAQGYAIMRRETSPHSVAMKHPVTGDKIIITRKPNNHWVYACAYDDSDAGSIIDFIQKRQGGHLGEVRRILQRWSGSPPLLPPESYASRVEKSVVDRPSILRRCETLQIAQEQPYLKTRAVGHKELLTRPRFNGRIHHDPKHGAACFLYEDGEGVCGIEERNDDFKGFVKGSGKGIWRSNCYKEDKNLVFTEGVINALSYYLLHPNYQTYTRFMALGGGWSEKTKLLLESAAKKHPGDTIILAFDNDTQGRKYEAQARELAAKSGKHIVTHFPETPGIDWNKQLTDALELERQQSENYHRDRLPNNKNSGYKVR